MVAAGGAAPGFPDAWVVTEAPLGDGGVRITATMPVVWVEYAIRGGQGKLPPRDYLAGGLAPPVPMATATLDITADYALQWRFQHPDGEVEGPGGTPAAAPPELPDGVLVAALDAAREQAEAPRAMPATEPRRAGDKVIVDLWAIGEVAV